ncbi:hypothetical protein BE20_05935 [Sorangium cellulosum]|nr:hypothetical protein BE20_05935 [Sorangium cellulosum]
MRQRSTTTGGADDTVEFDTLGRAIRWLWYGPDPSQGSRDAPRLMQEIVYDALGEHVARRSVPVSEDTPEREMLYDRYEHDAGGREVRHTTPSRSRPPNTTACSCAPPTRAIT